MKSFKEHQELDEVIKATMYKDASKVWDDAEPTPGATVSHNKPPMANPHTSDKVHKLAISDLKTHEPLSKTSKQKAHPNTNRYINDMAKSIKQGYEIPPIVVRRTGTTYQVIDGHHRLEAHKRAGVKHIDAHVVHDYHVKKID